MIGEKWLGLTSRCHYAGGRRKVRRKKSEMDVVGKEKLSCSATSSFCFHPAPVLALRQVCAVMYNFSHSPNHDANQSLFPSPMFMQTFLFQQFLC